MSSKYEGSNDTTQLVSYCTGSNNMLTLYNELETRWS